MSLLAKLSAAVDDAFLAADDLKVTATIRLGPTLGAHDDDTDTTPVTWAFEGAVQCVAYDDEELQQAVPIEQRYRKFIVRSSDLGGYSAEQEGEVIDAGFKWEIFKVMPDPGYLTWKIFARNPQPEP